MHSEGACLKRSKPFLRPIANYHYFDDDEMVHAVQFKDGSNMIYFSGLLLAMFEGDIPYRVGITLRGNLDTIDRYDLRVSWNPQWSLTSKSTPLIVISLPRAMMSFKSCTWTTLASLPGWEQISGLWNSLFLFIYVCVYV